MTTGNLYLIPVPLSGGGITSMSNDAIQATHALSLFIAERSKTARAFLKSVQHPVNQSSIEIIEIPKQTDLAIFMEVINKLKNGLDVGLISEAGMPCIADPGYELVMLAHKNNIKVIPFAGPNSMMIALMASGLYAQQFNFHGYLPAKKDMLRDKLIQIVNEIKKTGTTQIFMETPYRNKQVLDMMKTNIPADLHFCIACDLTTLHQHIRTKKIREWKPEEFQSYYDKTAIFILGK